jgi:hypothetical protein
VDAKRAIEEYNQAYLDNKLLTVEYADKGVKIIGGARGKTLRVGRN